MFLQVNADKYLLGCMKIEKEKKKMCLGSKDNVDEWPALFYW